MSFVVSLSHLWGDNGAARASVGMCLSSRIRRAAVALRGTGPPPQPLRVPLFFFFFFFFFFLMILDVGPTLFPAVPPTLPSWCTTVQLPAPIMQPVAGPPPLEYPPAELELIRAACRDPPPLEYPPVPAPLLDHVPAVAPSAPSLPSLSFQLPLLLSSISQLYHPPCRALAHQYNCLFL
jgi:hypothetical protein